MDGGRGGGGGGSVDVEAPCLLTLTRLSRPSHCPPPPPPHLRQLLVTRGEWGVWKWGERDIIYLSVATTLSPHGISDFCIDLGSDGSHFCVSFIISCDGQSLSQMRRQCPLRLSRRPQLKAFTERLERRAAEADSNRGRPSAYQPNVLPLGQTGSHPRHGRDASNYH